MTDTAALRRLAAEIEKGLEDLESIAQEAKAAFASVLPENRPTRTELRVVGSILHDFYTAAENIFQLIAADVDGGVPTTPDWHKRLLAIMGEEINKVRPAAISGETVIRLNDYLGFRHIFRNVYGLEWARMKPLVRSFPKVHEVLARDLDRFRQELHELADKLER